MLHYIKFKNFLSFRDEQELSFEATKDTDHDEFYTVEIENKGKVYRILKAAFLYGANASGKSNLMKVFNMIMTTIIQPRDRNQSLPCIHFAMNTTSSDVTSYFELSFFINSIRYLLQVEFDSMQVYSESLFFFPNNIQARIYERTVTADHNASYKWGDQASWGAGDKKALRSNTLYNMTFLSAIARTDVGESEVAKVYDYFEKHYLSPVYPDVSLAHWTSKRVDGDERWKDSVLELLQKADFNITDIFFKNEDAGINSELKHDISSTIETMPEQRREIFFSHTTEGGKTDMSASFESAGTLRYYGLSGPLVKTIRENCFLPVDEIESSLHYELVLHYVKTFLLNSKPQSQLLLTTHNTMLLGEPDLIRKDSVWFTEKDESGASELYCLADLKPRKGVSWLNAYKAGKFGAKPKPSTPWEM